MVDDLYQITVEPLAEPVTLAQVKEWLRIETTADDTLLTALITTVRQFGEKFCNRIFTETDIDCFFAGVNYSNRETVGFVQIRRAPLIAIDAVQVYSGGSYVAFTDYSLKQTNGFSRLLFTDEVIADDDAVYPIKVSGSFGYETVPEDLKTAVLAHIAYLYENRGDTVSEGRLSMPMETRSIYTGKYRIINTFG